MTLSCMSSVLAIVTGVGYVALSCMSSHNYSVLDIITEVGYMALQCVDSKLAPWMKPSMVPSKIRRTPSRFGDGQRMYQNPTLER